MIVMGIDTALQRCSVAVLKDGVMIAKRVADMQKGHAEVLAPMVAETIARAGVTLKSLDRVGVVIGPGGFTGVRVGLAFARGLGIGGAVGIIGVSSLEAIAAASAATTRFVAPVIDARRGEVYAALYGQDGVEHIAPFVATPEATADRLASAVNAGAISLIGSGADFLGRNWPIAPGDAQIDPVTVAQIAENAPPPNGPPAPLYLRAPDAKPSAT